jgi:hypothetical protein
MPRLPYFDEMFSDFSDSVGKRDQRRGTQYTMPFLPNGNHDSKQRLNMSQGADRIALIL